MILSASSDNNETVIYENPLAQDILRIAVPVLAAGAGTFIMLNPQTRGYVMDKWTRITSPNHMSPHEITSFHLTPWEDEVNQETQCDKGVHFTFSYLPVIPLAYTLDRTYSFMTAGRIREKPLPFFVASSALIVGGMGLIEELQDGKQLGEGFDVFDMTANISGIALGLLHYYGHLDYITVFWSFNRQMYRNDDFSDRWPWWVYMAGYEFSVNINVLKLLTNNSNNNKIYNSIVRRIGFLPELDYLKNISSIY